MNFFEAYEDDLDAIFTAVLESGAIALSAKGIISQGKNTAIKAVTKPTKPLYKAIDKGADKFAKAVVKLPSKDELNKIPDDVYEKYLKDVAKVKGLFKASTIMAAGVAINFSPLLLPFSPVVQAALVAMPFGSTFQAAMFTNLASDKEDKFTQDLISKFKDKTDPKKIMKKATEILNGLKNKTITPEEAAEEMKKLDVESRGLAKGVDTLKSKLMKLQEKGIEHIVKNTRGIKECTDDFREYVECYLSNRSNKEFSYGNVVSIIENAVNDAELKVMEFVIKDYVKEDSNSSYGYLFERTLLSMI